MTVTRIQRRGRVEMFPRESPADWRDDPPGLDWMVDGCFLRGTVAMLSGDGGIGKSLLMQMLCTAAALGRPWLGMDVEQCNSLAFFCEDDFAELKRRQARINRHYGCGPGDLSPALYAARVGCENVLMEFDRREDTPKPTIVFSQLRHAIAEHEARLVILDTVADVYGGNEIIRVQVRRFISALRKLAVEMQGCVILTAHPSNEGAKSGTGISGSTAWNNSVRARLYLTRAKEDDDGLILKTMKNNQGPGRGKIPLHWEEGVFVREDARAPGILDRLELPSLVLRMVRDETKRGQRVVASRTSRSSIAAIARESGALRDFSRSQIEGAVDKLIEDGRLVVVEIGPPSRRYSFIRAAEDRLPGEDE